MMAEQKKKTVKEPEPSVGPDSESVNGPETWKLGGIFWGLLFITCGILALLNNFGYITLNLSGLWQLWPLLIIVWGISLLRFTGPLWKAVAILLMVLTLAFVSWVAVDDSAFKNQRTIAPQHVLIAPASQGIQKAELSIDSGAGKVDINSKDMSDIVKADLYSNVSALRQSTSQDGALQRISIKSEGTGGWWIGGVRNDMDVVVSRRLPLTLLLTSGASEVHANLSELRLEKLALDLGASSANIRIGDNSRQLYVTIDAGASSVDLQVPSQSGVRVEIDEGLSSKGLRGFEVKGEGVYETPNYNKTANQIIINGSIGATSLTIDRY